MAAAETIARPEVSKGEGQGPAPARLCACGCGQPATYGCDGYRRACYLRRWMAAHPGRRRRYRLAYQRKHGREKMLEQYRTCQRALRARKRAEAAAGLPPGLSPEGAKTMSGVEAKAGHDPGHPCAQVLSS